MSGAICPAGKNVQHSFYCSQTVENGIANEPVDKTDHEYSAHDMFN